MPTWEEQKLAARPPLRSQETFFSICTHLSGMPISKSC